MSSLESLYIITPSLTPKIYDKILKSKLKIDYIQLRDYYFNLEAFNNLSKFILAISRQKPEIKIVINQNLFEKLLLKYTRDDILEKLKIGGIHCSLKSSNFKIYPQKYFFLDNFLSCHSYEEILLANQYHFSNITLSPLFKTTTHQDVEPLGLKKFHELAACFSGNVFALGGIKLVDKVSLKRNSIAKIAVVSSFFES